MTSILIPRVAATSMYNDDEYILFKCVYWYMYVMLFSCTWILVLQLSYSTMDTVFTPIVTVYGSNAVDRMKGLHICATSFYNYGLSK